MKTGNEKCYSRNRVLCYKGCMWPKNYKDYPIDDPMIKYPVEPGLGIVGCEMHEINGWGEERHHKKRKKNMIAKLLAYLFGTEKETLE